jgi:hypothetical protein
MKKTNIVSNDIFEKESFTTLSCSLDIYLSFGWLVENQENFIKHHSSVEAGAGFTTIKKEWTTVETSYNVIRYKNISNYQELVELEKTYWGLMNIKYNGETIKNIGIWGVIVGGIIIGISIRWKIYPLIAVGIILAIVMLILGIVGYNKENKEDDELYKKNIEKANKIKEEAWGIVSKNND